MGVLKACQKQPSPEPSVDLIQTNHHKGPRPHILAQRMKRDGKGGFHFEIPMAREFDCVKRWKDMEDFISLVYTANPQDPALHPKNTALISVPHVIITSLKPISCGSHGDWSHLPPDARGVDDTKTEELWTLIWNDIDATVNELPWPFALYIYVIAEAVRSRKVWVFVSRCPLQVQDNHINVIDDHLALLDSSDT